MKEALILSAIYVVAIAIVVLDVFYWRVG